MSGIRGQIRLIYKNHNDLASVIIFPQDVQYSASMFRDWHLSDMLKISETARQTP